MASPHFEEKILYKTHQHWIIPVLQSIKIFIIIVLPLTVWLYFSVNSVLWMWVWFFILSGILLLYEHYLWNNSWLLIGNQKVTLSVRNGIFSQFAMNIRYRNIRDCAVSKNSFLGFLLKYGTLFIRSSSGVDGDFRVHHVPKVGKVYALINALSRYNDDERSSIDTIEKLHNHHIQNEFSGTIDQKTLKEENIGILHNIAGIIDVIELDTLTRESIRWSEEIKNHGVHEVLRRTHILAFLHDSTFRTAAWPMTTKTISGEVYFPWVPFPEVHGKDVISASPGVKVHQYLRTFFPYATDRDATVLVGWNE